MRKIVALLITVSLIVVLAVGCSQSPSKQTNSEQSDVQSNTAQNVLQKALNNWQNKPEHQLINWSIKENQSYPLKSGSYQAIKTTEATEEHYDKGQIHATSSEKSGAAINHLPSTLEQGQASDQWQASETLSYHKYSSPGYDNGTNNKWMLSKNEETPLLLPSLPMDFLNALKNSKSLNNISFTQTDDTYQIVAKPEFYASLPQFLEDTQKNMRFPVYPKAVKETINDGKATMMDYNAQKVTIKSMDTSIIVDKKTLNFKEVVFHYQLELALSGGTPAKVDYVQTMKRTGNFQKAFQIPAEALKAKDNDNN
jgi:hypothetical protein